MNVFLYTAIVTLLGVVASGYIGSRRIASGALQAMLIYGVFSVVLGFVLAVPLVQLVGGACRLMGITREAACIATDDQTVWYLAIPLLACPLYFISMAMLHSASAEPHKSPAARRGADRHGV